MLVTVRSVTGPSPQWVSCESSLGVLVAVWRGDTTPHVGSQHDVEMDAVGALVWSDGARIVDADGANEHGQALTGLVQEVEADSLVVRIGDSVVLLEVAGEPPLGVVGGAVTVRPSRFELWPTNT
ncbi:MAG: hypothetical protein R2731_11380 [Nocardioides sp.]